MVRRVALVLSELSIAEERLVACIAVEAHDERERAQSCLAVFRATLYQGLFIALSEQRGCRVRFRITSSAGGPRLHSGRSKTAEGRLGPCV